MPSVNDVIEGNSFLVRWSCLCGASVTCELLYEHCSTMQSWTLVFLGLFHCFVDMAATQQRNKGKSEENLRILMDVFIKDFTENNTYCVTVFVGYKSHKSRIISRSNSTSIYHYTGNLYFPIKVA